MGQETKNKLTVFWPWLLTAAVLGAVTLIGMNNSEDYNPFEAKFRKVDLLSTMRIQLLESTEAEKNAVLAITDEASADFADQARRTANAIETSRKEIESIIHQDNLPQEIALIDEFNSCWSQYRELNETVLNLATQNTNLKAQKISANQCAQEMEHFEQSLSRIISRNTQANRCNNVVSLSSYAALTASLKIFALHKPHIEEASDQEMDKIENSIKAYDESARTALTSLHDIVELRGDEDLKNAEVAYQEFMNLTADVLRLSRMNTNIKSAALSLGKNRIIASQCQEILTTFKETVQTTPYKATR
jgi:hypothetical protein